MYVCLHWSCTAELHTCGSPLINVCDPHDYFPHRFIFYIFNVALLIHTVKALFVSSMHVPRVCAQESGT